MPDGDTGRGQSDAQLIATLIRAFGGDPHTPLDQLDPEIAARVAHNFLYITSPDDATRSQVPPVAELTKYYQTPPQGAKGQGQTTAQNLLGSLSGYLSAYATARTRVSETKEQSRRYVDVPTPQEFLDDFHTGLFTYMQNELQAGRLNQANYNFLIEPRTGLEQLLLDEYTAFLGQQAASGKQIFSVAGTSPDIQLIGERPGEDTTRTTQEQLGETLSTGQTRATTEQTQERLRQQEQLFQRNKLGIIHTVSPMAWMSQRFTTPGALATWIQDQKGVRLRTYETEAAAPISTPVRQQSLVS